VSFFLVILEISNYIGCYKNESLRGCVMAKTFVWENEMKSGIERSVKEKKPILLDFFSPG
jgi:hypothetical protein